MGQLRVATFNCEWMISFFGAPKDDDWLANPSIPATFPGAARGSIKLDQIVDVHDLCRRLADVIQRIDPDVLFVEEGPPLTEQMRLFVQMFLGDAYTVHRSNRDNQSIHALVKKHLDPKIQPWTPNGEDPKVLWGNIPFYPWGWIAPEDRKAHRFARRPLLLKCAMTPGENLILCGVHTKSKFSTLKTLAHWENRSNAPASFEDNPVLNALTTRIKLSAEVKRLREQLVRILAMGQSHASIAVLGDFNDGPFFDLMEQELLIHNILDELVGSFLEPNTYFKHAMEPERLAQASTAKFRDPLRNGQVVEELIDHVLVSPAIWSGQGAYQVRADSCVVENAAWQLNTIGDPEAARDNRPSDHKPVSVVLEW